MTSRDSETLLADVDRALAGLPAIPPGDDLVRRTLDRVGAAGPAGERRSRRSRRLPLVLAFGSIAVVLVVVGLSTPAVFRRQTAWPEAGQGAADRGSRQVDPQAGQGAGRYTVAERTRGAAPDDSLTWDDEERGQTGRDADKEGQKGDETARGEVRNGLFYENRTEGQGVVDRPPADIPASGEDTGDLSRLGSQARIVPVYEDGKASGFRCIGSGCGRVTEQDFWAYRRRLLESDPTLPPLTRDAVRGLDQDGEGDEPDRSEDGEVAGVRGGDDTGIGAIRFESEPANARVIVDGVVLDSEQTEVPVATGKHEVTVEREGWAPLSQTVAVDRGERVTLTPKVTKGEEGDRGGQPFAERRYLPAQGYFANTYQPGDPTLAWLAHRLEAPLLANGRPLRLEAAAQPYTQPFDAPTESGLAVYLSADRAQVEGETRLVLQVGLKGAERPGSRRAPLNAALVVDLRAIPDEAERQALWTLADELVARHEAGDRFSLLVAGVADPLRVRPEGFDAGAVRRALATALEERIAAGDSAAALGPALSAARAQVAPTAGSDDAFGTSVVLLVSAAPPGLAGDAAAEAPALEAELMTAGVTLSALAVGSRADGEHLARLARAGQGRRRLVAGPDDARAVLQAELAATGRVVARAVRLRIRLAEGVRLVEVLGSHPLGNDETGRVRTAEAAIDRRVSETLGIAADRGEDEDGIQVVIPAFYAGDAHVVLLDVVVPGPGAVAEVQVRYKDLIGLTNAVAQAGLALPATAAAEGPLVDNVRKNVLAQRLSEDLQQAAEAVAAGEAGVALEHVERAAGRLAALQAQTPSLTGDAELERDAELLAGYRDLLQDRAAWEADREVRDHVAWSLAYAGRAKRSAGR